MRTETRSINAGKARSKSLTQMIYFSLQVYDYRLLLFANYDVLFTVGGRTFFGCTVIRFTMFPGSLFSVRRADATLTVVLI